MANHCYNYLSFEGEAENVKRVIDLFKDLIEEQSKTGEGVLPKGYDGRYFFDICENGDENFMFWTKWSPPTDVLSQLAQEYGVTITNEVEELSDLIFGIEVYYPTFLEGFKNQATLVKKQYLDKEDFDLIEYNEDGGVVAFKGEPCEVESEAEFLEQLLREKYNL